MAKVALISLYDTVALGLRYLSASLKEAGHDVTVIYLKQYEVLMREDLPDEGAIDEVNYGLCSRGEIVYCYPRLVSEPEHKGLVALLKEKQVDVVGISLTSKFINTARQVTEWVKDEVGVPVIWGGIEPTIN
ncbi:MAG: cobalamin-dependent protein, partial [Candidatus Omnitrophica bacterium]|nr:cobalamin-dependent protein [Candidatus Omnitrophota bacterium]